MVSLPVHPRYDFAFFVCANGLGHLRRCVAVASRIPARSVILTCAQNVERLRPKIEVGDIDFIDFRTDVNAEALRRGDTRAALRLQQFPEIDARVIVSDNLPEILESYPHAILQGSFLWHEAIPNADERYKRHCRELLERHRPIMIGVDAFAMPAVRSQTRFHGVGLYRYCPRMELERNSILIAAGRGGGIAQAYRSLVTEVATHALPEGIQTIFVEPDLLPNQYPKWIQPAVFDCRMYASLRAAIIRPGLGTICDVLSARAPVFTAFEPDNLEMQHNAERLEAISCGWYFETPLAAYHAAVEYLRKDPPLMIPAFEPNGVTETAEFLRTAKGLI